MIAAPEMPRILAAKDAGGYVRRDVESIYALPTG